MLPFTQESEQTALRIYMVSQAVVAHAFQPTIWEAEAGTSLWVQGQPSLQSEFQDSQDCYTAKLCLDIYIYIYMATKDLE